MKHPYIAAWISAAAGIVVIVTFLTGKTNLGDFWKSHAATSRPGQPPEAHGTAQVVTLAELLAIQSGKNFTQVQKAAREAQLNGKRVTLSGYLVSAEYPMGKIALEISTTKDGTETLLVWADPSTKSSWTNISKGTLIELQTTLRKPLMGDLVGEQAQLVKITSR